MTTPVESDVGKAISIIQRSRTDDEAKSLYLSFRACYLGENEATRLAGVNINTLAKWREDDPLFFRAESQNLQEFQEVAHRKALSIEYVRNYRLVLEKDMTILLKSLEDSESMTNAENQYLNKMRGSYTPEGFDRLSRIVRGDGGGTMDDLFQFIREREVIVREREISSAKVSSGNNPELVRGDSPGDPEHIVDSGEG